MQENNEKKGMNTGDSGNKSIDVGYIYFVLLLLVAVVKRRKLMYVD